MDKKEIKKLMLEILDRENRALSIREITEKLKIKNIDISQPTALNYLKEIEEEGMAVEVDKNGKEIQKHKTKNSPKKTTK